MKRPAIIIDLDGTLCDSSHRKHFMEGPKKDWDGFYGGIADDKPNNNVAMLIYHYRTIDYRLLFVSGRPSKYREITGDWLDIHLNFSHIGDYQLFMRPNNDFRSDDIVKKEIFHRDIEPHYQVELVLDDRDRVVKMWRELGLECWQVAEGNF